MTPRQALTLAFIRAYQASNAGASPTLREIAAGIGVKQITQAARVVGQLEVRKRIKRHPGLPRGIEVCP